MFDISFSELLLIGVVALVVLGPERLPRVARTVGHMFGRAQRYMNDVKSDIQREIDLDEINSIKKQMEDASSSIKQSVNQFGNQIKDPLAEARDAVNELGKDTEKVAQSITDSSKIDSQKKEPEPALSSDVSVDGKKE
ncbi:Sec-independent protein translocase protein TatB [Paenalcaligenes faecalis]|uniref:Sec-independent protein translocase protein TatB n=1 Tax=Paenalcaligenes faecalis TaxID=2980099 RepID=UPI0022B9B0E1|nr:Sec-independent protein translocase protein TatB [Paenalcaligenes faecalis]